MIRIFNDVTVVLMNKSKINLMLFEGTPKVRNKIKIKIKTNNKMDNNTNNKE